MTLYVKPISAILTHDTDTFSNMDPYVIIEVGGTKQKTKVHKEGGKKPKWDEVFTFHPKGNKMVITVMDKDTFSDDKVGTGAVDLQKYMKDPIEHKQYISLTHGSKSAGKIYISIRYVGQGGKQAPGPNSNWGGNQPQQQNNWSNQGQQWGANQNQGQSNWNQQQQGSNWGQGQQNPNQAQNWGQGQQPQNTWGNQNNQNSSWGQQNQFVNPGQNNNQQWNQQGQQSQQSSWGNPNQPPGSLNNQNSSWGQNNNNQQVPIGLAGQLAGNLISQQQQPNNSNWGNQGQPQSQWGSNNNGWANPNQKNSGW